MLPHRHLQATGLPQSGLYSLALRVGNVMRDRHSLPLDGSRPQACAIRGHEFDDGGPAGVGCDTTVKGIS